MSFVAIRQYDDAELLVRKSHDRVAEAHGLAGVRDDLVVDPPAIAVPHPFDIRVHPRDPRLGELAAIEGLQPMHELIHRRVNAAVAEDRARHGLVGLMPWLP